MNHDSRPQRWNSVSGIPLKSFYSAEDIPAGEALLDYAGKVKVCVADSKRGSLMVADGR